MHEKVTRRTIFEAAAHPMEIGKHNTTDPILPVRTKIQKHKTDDEKDNIIRWEIFTCKHRFLVIWGTRWDTDLINLVVVSPKAIRNDDNSALEQSIAGNIIRCSEFRVWINNIVFLSGGRDTVNTNRALTSKWKQTIYYGLILRELKNIFSFLGYSLPFVFTTTQFFIHTFLFFFPVHSFRFDQFLFNSFIFIFSFLGRSIWETICFYQPEF